jgi:hypothetical protein
VLQLRQELLDSGGWTTTSSWLPHCIPRAFVTFSTGSVGGTSCIQGRLLVSKGYSHDGVLDYSSQDNLPPKAWSLKL